MTTTYVVLRRQKAIPDETAKYEACPTTIDAHGAAAALRKAGEQWGNGTYVAVAQGKWNEEPVHAESYTRVKVGV